MSKKSFNDIEQIIRDAAEAHQRAFDEEAWKRMEFLLDEEKDRKKPFAFWLWLLVPVLIGAGALTYFGLNDNSGQKPSVVQKSTVTTDENSENRAVDINENTNVPLNPATPKMPGPIANTTTVSKADVPAKIKIQNSPVTNSNNNTKKINEKLIAKKNISGSDKAKTSVKISGAYPEADTGTEALNVSAASSPDTSKVYPAKKAVEVFVVKVEAGKAGEKEIEKIIDSVISKTVHDKKSKSRISKFYIIVATGAEASGVKLFSADKITSRFGLSAGYQITKKLSIQTGFYSSSKKYIAGPGDYTTKPGSYWNMVIINSIDANCKVYEIPLLVRYNFTPDKKLNLFASAGLSTYIMKKETYQISYNRYGTAHKAEAYYSGNKSFFSVLRLSVGVEKKVSKKVSLFVSPGIAIPLSGVGEGEVKLYSEEIALGLRFTPFRKNKGK